MKGEFKAIVFSLLSDEIEFWELDATNEEEVWEEIEEAQSNYDYPILLNKERLRNLVKGLEQKGWLKVEHS